MSGGSADEVRYLTEKLGKLARLDDDDRAAIAALPITVKKVGAGSYLIREGSTPTECCLLVNGYACRHKLTANGARQIMSFHIRGDLVDAQHLLLATADHNVQTITEATVGWIPKPALHALIRERAAVAEAIWRDSLIDASIFREWVLNVGRRDAKARIAHMLCEFVERCRAVGLGTHERFELPMTQEQIADATGLTSVHVNRMLRALEEDGVLMRERRSVELRDWTGLQRIAGFSPAYLHEIAA